MADEPLFASTITFGFTSAPNLSANVEMDAGSALTLDFTYTQPELVGRSYTSGSSDITFTSATPALLPAGFMSGSPRITFTPSHPALGYFVYTTASIEGLSFSSHVYLRRQLFTRTTGSLISATYIPSVGDTGSMFTETSSSLGSPPYFQTP